MRVRPGSQNPSRHTLKLVDPLDPRDAFFGGRTNAVKLHHEVDQANGEKIKYIDVTSLYPWVNRTQEYPVGHPHVLVNPDDQDIRHYFGMATIDILPPRELYHLVLPHRHKGKLMFPLCQACVEEEMPRPLLEKSHCCLHSYEQPTLRGTWCTPELVKAVAMGYTLIKIHEVLHFPPERRKRGLFEDYVNTWLKIKQESTGYPARATTPQYKTLYVTRYKEEEGLDLDPSLIQKNPGRKATAKLMLNSFWGKFGENLLKPTTTAVHQAPHQSLQRHTSSPNRQRRHGRNRPRQSRGQSTRQTTDQHLRRRLHHLSRKTQTIQLPGTAPITRPLL